MPVQVWTGNNHSTRCNILVLRDFFSIRSRGFSRVNAYTLRNQRSLMLFQPKQMLLEIIIERIVTEPDGQHGISEIQVIESA